jgi:hypothetical protein
LFHHPAELSITRLQVSNKISVVPIKSWDCQSAKHMVSTLDIGFLSVNYNSERWNYEHRLFILLQTSLSPRFHVMTKVYWFSLVRVIAPNVNLEDRCIQSSYQMLIVIMQLLLGFVTTFEHLSSMFSVCSVGYCSVLTVWFITSR